MTATPKTEVNPNQFIPAGLESALFSPAGLGVIACGAVIVIAKIIDSRGGIAKLATARWGGITEKTDVKGQAIEQSVKALLNILGKDNPDGSKSFKSTNFDFERLGDNVIVRAKNGEAVLTDGVLSPNVSEKQLQALDKVQSVVDMHHQIQQNSQQESQFRSMHR